MWNHNLLKLRKKENLLQKNIAEKIGISQDLYSKYERGEREPDIETLIKFANYYNTTLDKLCDREINK